MSIFSIGLSGMNAAQNALSATGNNISNAFTPGYNRELPLFAEPRSSSGVEVSDLQRQFDRYVAVQLNDATSASSALKSYETQVSQIDNLLADREAGLAPLMQNFFSSLEDLAGAPSDPAARQGVIGNADTLSAQFRSFDDYLQDMQQGINGQIKDEVGQINNQTKQLAQLNREIGIARARSGEAPNSLLNQRDRVVAELSERLDVTLNIQDGKTYNLTLSNGQQLVSGSRSFDLEAMASAADPERTVVGFRDAGGEPVELARGTISGGTLGGLTSFRSETLDKTQNQLGRLAISFAEGFNAQHRQGVDLDGNRGEDVFTVGAPRAYASERNSGSARIDSIAIDDIDGLRATDYEIRVANDNPGAASDFTIVRKDNGQALEAGSDFSFDAGELSVGGVTLSFDNVGNLNKGDRFEVQPVRHAAGGMENLISDLDKIAAGSAVDTEGDLAIEGLQAAPGALSSGSAPWQLDVTDAGGSFDIAATDDAGNVVNFAGVGQGDEINIDGVAITLGKLADGQSLTLQAGGGTGDNRNALKLQDLQNEELVGGSASFNQAYGSMVSDVGNRTNVVKVNLDAKQGLTDQLTAVQQSESGVNLNEEAANLLRYQQFYQANAKVIEIGSNVLDTILGLRA